MRSSPAAVLMKTQIIESIGFTGILTLRSVVRIPVFSLKTSAVIASRYSSRPYVFQKDLPCLHEQCHIPQGTITHHGIVTRFLIIHFTKYVYYANIIFINVMVFC